MPEYEVTDPRSGRTLILTGDSPPTEAELEEIFAAYRPMQGYHRLAEGVGDLAVGALKGAGSTVQTITEAAKKYVPGFAALDVGPRVQIGQTLEPTNTMQKVGRVAEQAGEYLLPSRYAKGAATLATAPKVARAVRIGTEAAGAVPVALAHGENPVVAGVSSAVLPVVGQKAGELAKATGRRIVEKIVKPSGEALSRVMAGRGQNRAASIIDTIIERRLGSAGKAQGAIEGAEQEIDDLLKGPAGTTPVEAHKTVPAQLQETREVFKQQVTPTKDLDKIAKYEEKLLADRAGHTPLGKTKPVVRIVAGKPVVSDRNVYRSDITAREAIDLARGESRRRGAKVGFGGKLSDVQAEASKAVELGLREAAKSGVPAMQAPSETISKLIPAREALVKMEERFGGGPSLVDAAVGGKAGLALRILRSMGGLQGGFMLDRAAKPIQQTLENAILRGLLLGGTREEKR
jgi:hypothetical protein